MVKLVYGVGVNDANYVVAPSVAGKRTVCPYYQTWKNMLQRCYSPKFHLLQHTYMSCVVCDEWLLFSNFKKWMEAQDWVGKQLDKDILFEGNKEYSPEACVFVSRVVNMFLVNCSNPTGKYMVGVTVAKRSGKFNAIGREWRSSGRNKTIYLGGFESELEAHLAWKQYKHDLAIQLADEQTDERIAEALRTRFCI